ncbi:MAG: DEAD/DEAH box helicase family protein [Thermomicrobiales bacterium]
MPPMTLQFDAELPYQRDAIDAVVNLFAGQPLAGGGFDITFSAGPMLQTEFGVGNALALGDAELLENLQAMQEHNGIPRAATLAGRDFAIEMETGTGKTYVFLRTAFALHAAYGFSKFIIVVPSVAIREGVLHSIETMRAHFRALYGVPFDAFVYDSKQISKLRQFATANTLQFMVITLQAFQRDVEDGDAGGGNVIYREQDRLSGYRPIDYVQATHPVVIIDEPQNAMTTSATKAIARLNPLCTLRYSATYESAQKVYRLGPIEAMDQRLVKRIEVASVREDDDFNTAFLRLHKVDAKKATAQVEINHGSGSAPKRKKVTVKPGSDLAVLSGQRQEYANGFTVSEISFEPGNAFVAFTNGARVGLGQAAGGLDDAVMREQVRETVREHFAKEVALRPLGVKVLSLFFIDRVANYRVHHEGGGWSLGKIGRWFEEAYRELGQDPRYREAAAAPVETAHNGYFSQDKAGGYKDSSERRETKDDAAAYELIMRDKERLLSLEEPLRFIFSHSALREGWDNPNVFQICTLNESRSEVKKRQEIGRGLRLPVNQAGERIHDEQINRLTVVANESYRQFAAALQTEYAEDTGIRFGLVEPHDFARLPAAAPMAALLGEDAPAAIMGEDASRQLWQHLQARGYLDAEGRVLDAFDPRDDAFVLDVPPAFADLRPQIVDAISAKLLRNRVVNRRDRRTIAVRKNVLLDEEFRALWARISQKTRYRITLDSDALARTAAARIAAAPAIRPVQIAVETAQLAVGQAGVEVDAVRRSAFREVARAYDIPDILAYLQNETELTRQTLARILNESGRLQDLAVNPQAFITLATEAIRRTLDEMKLPGLEYERLPDQHWAMDLLEGRPEEALTRYLTNLYQVQNARKSPFDYIEYQSDVEHQFARSLDQNERVKFFVKLPVWFKVDTPVGDYNPDWAILLESDTGGETLYLVRETKGSLSAAALRQLEAQKIACGRKHFAAIDVDFAVATTFADVIRGGAASLRG